MKYSILLSWLLLILVDQQNAQCKEPDDPLRLVRIEMDILGIGRFTYSGKIRPGDTFALPIPFKAVSDALRNLVINDPEAAIVSARIESEPDPNESNQDKINTETLGDLLRSLRGEAVCIIHVNGTEVTGTLVSIERWLRKVGEKESEEVLVTVSGKAGIESIGLDQIQRVTPLRQEMVSKIAAALEKLVDQKNGDERLLEIQFGGDQPRVVTIQLTRAIPKWRATYSYSGTSIQQRIIFENDTNQSWNDVEVLFTDRSPVLFHVPLYQMAHATLPILSMPDRPTPLPKAMQESFSAYVPNKAIPEDQLVLAEDIDDGHSGMGGGGGMGGGMGGGGMGGGGMGGTMGSGPTTSTTSGEKTSQPSLVISSDSDATTAIPETRWAAKPDSVGTPFAVSFQHLQVEPQKTHVVMTPDLKIESEPLLIYRSGYHEDWPLNSVKIVNRMPFRIPSGPLTLFDELGDAGEAMLPTLASDVEQMIHYALNGEVKIKKTDPTEKLKTRAIKFDESLHSIQVAKTMQAEVGYDIEDRSLKTKTVLIEHPKPTDGSTVLDNEFFDHENVGNFCYRLSTKPTESVKLVVKSERIVTEHFNFYPMKRVLVEEWIADPNTPDSTRARLSALLTLNEQLDRTRKQLSSLSRRLIANHNEISRLSNLLQRNLDDRNINNFNSTIFQCEADSRQIEADAKKTWSEGKTIAFNLGVKDLPELRDSVQNIPLWLKSLPQLNFPADPTAIGPLTDPFAR